ncbi:hypothetical protein ACMYSQ_011347 [Aspergillus niger]
MLLVLFVPVITKTDLLLETPSCPVFGRFRLPGPKSPERLQAPAPSSRSHSVSPKRTSLNRKDREKTDTGNIGISARSCDARRSKADLQSAGLPKAGQKRGLRWDGYAKGENRNSRVAPLARGNTAALLRNPSFLN